MDNLISRQAAIDEIEERKNANGYSNVTLISELNRLEGYMMQLPTADVIAKTEYDKLLAAAKVMHTWIFLHTADEFEAYDECGLTDEMNALLGSMGQFELR